VARSNYTFHNKSAQNNSWNERIKPNEITYLAQICKHPYNGVLLEKDEKINVSISLDPKEQKKTTTPTTTTPTNTPTTSIQTPKPTPKGKK
jgi:hypothetical protein